MFPREQKEGFYMTLSTESINKIGTVGVIGVGTMGKCILTELQKAGFTVAAYDPFAEAQEYIKEKNALLMKNPAELAENANLIILSLPAPKQVFETLSAFLEKMTPE